MAAAHHKLSNLTAIIDFNKICQSGRVDEVIGVDPLADKWRAFGWEVREIDGHDMAEVVDTLDALPLNQHRPTALIAHTVKGKGVSFMEMGRLPALPSNCVPVWSDWPEVQSPEIVPVSAF